MNWLAILAASVLAGVLGSMGLGGGGVLLLYLTLIETPQRTAQGINLVFILPVGLLGLWFHRRRGLVDGALIRPILLGGVVGVGVGTLAAGLLPDALLGRLFGGLVLLIALRELWGAVKILRTEGCQLWIKKSGEAP